MPKTIATTPSWYWPEGTPRVLGIPPYSLEEMLVQPWIQARPHEALLVSGDTRLSGPELAQAVHAASARVAAEIPPDSSGTLYAGPDLDGVVLVLGALASGRQVHLKALDAAEAARIGETLPAASIGEPIASRGTHPGTATYEPAVCLDGRFGRAWHSQRSLLAWAISIRGFLPRASTEPETWLSTFSPCTWEGMTALGAALIDGGTLVLAAPGEASREAATTEHPAWLFTSFEDAATTFAGSGRRRRSEGVPLRSALLSVDGPFDPAARGALTSSLGNALTVYGTAETGPMLASHPSWYLDESVGIPVTNMHVVPGDPETAERITTMWELIDHAMITAWSPSLMLGYEGPTGASHLEGHRFLTGMLAASDPNGMLYLLGDEDVPGR